MSYFTPTPSETPTIRASVPDLEAEVSSVNPSSSSSTTASPPSYSPDYFQHSDRGPIMARPKGTKKHRIRSGMVGSYPAAGSAVKRLGSPSAWDYNYIPRNRRERILEFADYTGVSGVYNIKRSRSWLRKGIWVILWLASWGACIWQSWQAIDKYVQYPVNVVSQMRYDENVSFPAVTICNLNPLRKSKYDKEIKPMLQSEYDVDYDITDTDIEVETFDAMKVSNSSKNKRGKLKESAKEFVMNRETVYRRTILRNIYDYNFDLDEAGHQIEQMLLDCSYQGTQCYPEDFHAMRHAQYGLCYSIRFPRNDYPSMVGPDNGLNLILITQQEDYIARLAPAAGFKVEIHDSQVIPVPEDKGFTISPGFSTDVGVRRLYLRRTPLPYNGTDCIDLNERARYMNLSMYMDLERQLNITTVYSNAACVKSCYIKRLADECKCVDPGIITFDVANRTFNGKPVRACDLGNPDDFLCAHKLVTEKDFCGKNTCPNACEENAFLKSVTPSRWPTDDYLKESFDMYIERAPPSLMDELRDTLVEELNDSDPNHPLIQLIKADKNIKFTWKQIADHLTYEQEEYLLGMMRDNLVKLQVFFQELNYESIVEAPAMDFVDLLVSLGGTIGLWIGMCFLTVVEIWELFFDLIFFNFK